MRSGGDLHRGTDGERRCACGAGRCINDDLACEAARSDGDFVARSSFENRARIDRGAVGGFLGDFNGSAERELARSKRLLNLRGIWRDAGVIGLSGGGKSHEETCDDGGDGVAIHVCFQLRKRDASIGAKVR